MRRLLAVSPHLDDAAFSAGGTIAAHRRDGWAVTILTCFTGNVARPVGFALACQLDKGLEPDVDYMALRRAEDLAACAVVGADAVHLPLLEAPHRGYDNVPALFGSRREDDGAACQLLPLLAQAMQACNPELVLGPLAIGDHVDHHAVRNALVAAAAGRQLLLWEDWPYLERADASGADRARSDAPPPAGLRTRGSSAPAVRVVLDDALRMARLRMCEAYGSQIGFQFGSRAGLAARILAVGEERLHAPR